MHLDSTFDALSNGTKYKFQFHRLVGDFWEKKLIFRNFHQKFSIVLTLDSYLSHPNAFFMIQNITAVSALQFDTSFAFLLLCKLSQLTVLK